MSIRRTEMELGLMDARILRASYHGTRNAILYTPRYAEDEKLILHDLLDAKREVLS